MRRQLLVLVPGLVLVLALALALVQLALGCSLWGWVQLGGMKAHYLLHSHPLREVTQPLRHALGTSRTSL
jgi:hypothetical protein